MTSNEPEQPHGSARGSGPRRSDARAVPSGKQDETGPDGLTEAEMLELTEFNSASDSESDNDGHSLPDSGAFSDNEAAINEPEAAVSAPPSAAGSSRAAHGGKRLSPDWMGPPDRSRRTPPSADDSVSAPAGQPNEPDMRRPPRSENGGMSPGYGRGGQAGLRRGLMGSMRRSLRYAAILLSAAGFAAAGYFAGNPDAGAPGWSRSDPARLMADNPEPELRHLTPQILDFGTDAGIRSESAAPGGAATERKPIVIRLILDRSRAEELPVSADAAGRWNDFFRIPDSGGAAVDAGNRPRQQQPAANADAVQKPYSAAEIGDAGSRAAGHGGQPGEAGSFEESGGVPAAAAESQLQPARTDLPAEQGLNGSGDNRPDQAPSSDESLMLRIAEMGKRIKSAEDRLLALEEEKRSQFAGLSLDGFGMNVRAWPLGEGAAVSHRSENRTAPVKSRAESKSVQSSLRTAQVGDVIEGYGTVLEVVGYDDGGRMLMMDSGAVYINWEKPNVD